MSKALGWLGVVLVGCGVVVACSSEDKAGKVCEPGATAACKGTGDCDGTWSCVKNGLAWGPCPCGSNTGGAAGSGGAGAAGGLGGSSTGGTGAVPACRPTGKDSDGDWFGDGDGDCKDDDANVNPGAIDYPGNGVDDDCSGTADDYAPCDEAITNLGDPDPLNGARALGLCQLTTKEEKKWGVIQAERVMADGKTGTNEKSHGLWPSVGANLLPRE